MSKLTRRTTVMAKTNDGAYGADPTPTAGANGILCNMTPLPQPQGNLVERNTIRDTMSPQGHVIGVKSMQTDFEMELKGGSLNGTVQDPEFHPFLLASGMQKETGNLLTAASGEDVSALTLGETITGGASSATGKVVGYIGTDAGEFCVADVSGTFQDGETVTGGTSSATVDLAASNAVEEIPIYRPQSNPASVQDVAVYYNMDGTQMQLLGGICDMSLNMSVDNYARMTFRMSSLYSTPTAVGLPSPTTLDLSPPVCRNLGLTVGSWAPTAINALTLSLNNVVSQRNDISDSDGILDFLITNRDTQGSIDPEVTAIGTYDVYTAWENGTTAAIQAVLGGSKGNRIVPFVPKSMWRSISHSDRQGYQTYNLPFTCRIDSQGGAGDDELYLSFA